MGNNITAICNCSDSVSVKQAVTEGLNQNDKNNSDEACKKSRAGRLYGTNAETVDLYVENIKYDHISNMKISDGFYYEGQILNGKRSGRGTIKTEEGQLVYEGDFKDDLYEGEGMWISDQGLVYTGNFSQGKRNGKGIMFSNESKYRYDGEWIEDLKCGNGNETNPDGSYYIGEFLNNKKNGNGIYTMNDGSIYEGEFKDDRIEGEGKFIWGPDRIYNGQWKNNSLHGFGIFIKKGKIYVGNFINDYKHGVGLYVFDNGNILVGNFEHGEVEGLSIVFLKEGLVQIIIMAKSKPQVVISDENEKNNIKLSSEYKDLVKFYENNKTVIESLMNTKS